MKSAGGATRKSIALQTKNEDNLTLFQQFPGHLVHVSVSALYYYLVSFPTALQHSPLILSFVTLVIHMTNQLSWPLGAFCSGHQLETTVESSACLKVSYLSQSRTSFSNSFPKQAQVSYVIYFISQSHLMSCMIGPTAPLDSHVYIMIAGWTLLTSPSAALAGIDRQIMNNQNIKWKCLTQSD